MWWEYVKEVAGSGASNASIARRTGIGQDVISRWSEGQPPRFDKLKMFARAYERPLLEALYRVGFLEEGDLGGEVHAGAGDLTNDQLVREVERRLALIPPNPGGRMLLFNDPEVAGGLDAGFTLKGQIEQGNHGGEEVG